MNASTRATLDDPRRIKNACRSSASRAGVDAWLLLCMPRARLPGVKRSQAGR